MTTARLTVIQNDPSGTLDRWAPWLEDELDVRIVEPCRGDTVPALDEVGDGLLVLGGAVCAYDDAAAPWLPALRDLLAAASSSGVPTLTICLGAQLLAVARGGRVQVAAPPGVEAGVVAVRWRPEAVGDPLVGPLLDRRTTPQPALHADAVVDLPRGAAWLASSAMYPYHAFRIGSAWGLQFHPEVGADRLAAWAAGTEGVDPAAVAAQAAAHDEDVAPFSRALAERFAGLIVARAAEACAVPA